MLIVFLGQEAGLIQKGIYLCVENSVRLTNVLWTGMLVLSRLSICFVLGDKADMLIMTAVSVHARY